MRKQNIQDGISRKCYRCGRVLPLELFPKNRYEKYGRAYLCKDCAKKHYIETSDAKRGPIKPIENLPGEEWRDVVGFEGIYRVSNMGRIISTYREIVRSGVVTRIFPRILRTSSSRGYLNVKLRKDGKTYTRKVHALVCEAFLNGRKNEETEVNHKNGIKADNRVENLEWCTPKYNIWHSYHITNRKPSGCKPVFCIETGVTYPSCMAAGRELNINNSSIARAANGTYNQMKGYHFKFVEQ